MFLGIFSRMKTHRGNGQSTPPEINLIATGGQNQITLTWDDVFETETGFAIYRSTSEGGAYSLITTTASNAVSYTDTGLNETTTYYYKLVAVGASSHEYTTSGITVLPAPSGLIVAPASSSQINLTWTDNSSSETGFEIERSNSSGSGFGLIVTTAANATSYNDTGLNSNTTYYYRVRAIGSVNSQYTAESSATTSPALNAPSNLQATAISSTRIDLSWTDNSSNETGFEIHRASSSGGSFSLIHTTTANVTTYSNTGLTASTAYYYKVRAVNGSGNTSFTLEATATTSAGTVPIAPTNLATSTVTNSSILITWTDNSSDETGFEVERSVDNNSSFVLVNTTAAGATSYNDTGLDEGRRYYYRVRATNGAGQSAYTGTVNEITTWSSPITYLGRGVASSSNTSTLSVALPTSPAPAEGNLMVMIVGTKTGKVIADTPTGWQTGANEGFIDYNGGAGGDRGSICGNVFWKICGASETGPVSVPIYNTNNSAHGAIFLFSKDSNGYWSIDISGSSHRTPATTSYSAVSWEDMSVVKGDAVFVASLINSDAITWTSQALSHLGTVTTTETNEEITDISTTTGNDQALVTSLYHVTNNASGNQKFTYTMTGSTSTADSPLGITIFIRLRNARSSPTYNAPLRTWRGDDLVHTTPSSYDAISIFDGMRISAEGPDAYTTRYTVASFGGRNCMKLTANLSTGLNRRTELSTNWQPTFPIGTQIIEEFRYETDSTATQPLGEWIFMQNHTGTPPTGGPYPANYPLVYLAWSYVGQTGWDNTPGASPGGELIVVNNCRPDGTNYIRNRYSTVRWKPNTSYRFRYHLRFDVASGDPVFKVWAAEDGNALTLLHEDYTYPTVPSTDAELGSLSMCGGTTKLGIYHHMVTNETTRINNINAGHTGITLYFPTIKRITQLPGDSFYFSDYTNNAASIYDLVDTYDEDNTTAPSAPLTVDFTTNTPITIDASGAAAGMIEEDDTTFTTISSGLRRSSIGALVEPSRTYVGAPADLENASWSKSNLAAGTSRTAIVPGVPAYEYISNGSTGILSGPVGTMGTFGTSKECLECIIELTGTSTGFYMSVENSSGSTTECVVSVTSIQSASPTVSLSSTNASTDKGATMINRGTGPNGGTVYHVCATYIPSAAGGSRRIRFRPNGSAAQAVGVSIIIHYYNLSVGSIGTSPFAGAGSRAADDIKVTIATGEYDVRYTLQDNTILYDYELDSISNELTIPTDLRISNSIARSSGTNPPSAIGQIKKLEISKFPVDYVEWDFDTCEPIDTPPPASGTDILLNDVGTYLKTSQAYNGEGYTLVGTTDKEVNLNLVPRDGNLDANNFNHRLELIRSDVSAGTLGSRELLGFTVGIPSGGLPNHSIPFYIFQAHSGDNAAQTYDMPVLTIEISNEGRVAYGESPSLANEIAIGNRIVEFETFGVFNGQARHNTGVIASAGSRLDFLVDYTSAINGAGKVRVYIRKNQGGWNLVYDRTESTAWANASDGGSEPNVHPFWKIGLYVPNCRSAADLAAQEALNGGTEGSFTVQLNLKDKIRTARLLSSDKYFNDLSVIDTMKPSD
jgi:hypothetical protein